MTSIFNTSLNRNHRGFLQPMFIFITGLFAVAAIPLIQFGLIYPLVYDFKGKKEVDRSTCNCGCWDTWFKGYYESWPGHYHHVYFNTTWQTGCIWVITVFYILLGYECVRYLMRSICAGNYRIIYCALFFLGIYSHQYTWWSYFGYFNDDFYRQLFHQTLFSLSEFYASWMVLKLATSNSPIDFKEGRIYTGKLDEEVSQISVLAAISLAHLAVGSLDQFIDQNLYGSGQFSQQSRNAGFILPDAFGVLFPIRDLFVLLPYVLELDTIRSDNQRLTGNFVSDHSSILMTSVKLVSKMFVSPHFQKAALIFFTLIFCGTVL